MHEVFVTAKPAVIWCDVMCCAALRRAVLRYAVVMCWCCDVSWCGVTVHHALQMTALQDWEVVFVRFQNEALGHLLHSILHCHR